MAAQCAPRLRICELEEQVDYRLSLTERRPKIVSLAATMCLEHFTAIIARELQA